MEQITEFVAARIREFRKLRKLSQAELAKRMDTATNTVSRWETYVYTPSISDIEELASVLDVEAIDFFPERNPAGKVGELLIAVRGLDEKDLEELIRYAHFRRATSVAR
jgi:transcriptional regulator with XRE-family HTH domain